MENLSTTPTMAKAIERAKDCDNKLVRGPGGFWAKEGWNPSMPGIKNVDFFGTTTINALVARQLMIVTKRKRGRGMSVFPIEVELIPTARFLSDG